MRRRQSCVLGAALVAAVTLAAAASAEPDPDTANTLRFEARAAGGGAGGGRGGEDATVSAGAAEVTPKPVKAGSVVTASVRTTTAGAPVRPTRVRCTGTIGNARVRGIPRARRGTASCTYRTPVTAKGRTLRGTISLTLNDTRFVRRFATRLT